MRIAVDPYTGRDRTPGSRLILVSFAVREEARFFRAAASPDQVQVIVTGMGQRNAQRSVEAALAQQRPWLVLTCGFAGALRPGLTVGTILYAEHGEAGVSAILSDLGAVPARFFCATRIAVTAAEKRALFSQTRADAVEMESEPICRICHERSIPCATVRVISDGPDEDLPLDFNALLTERMEMAYPRLAWRLVSSPALVPRLLRFGRQTQMAAARLGNTLCELLRRSRAVAG